MSNRRPPSPKRTATTAAQIFERLVEAILDGRFASGAPLREAAVAREWKVSRTPMREAVRRAAECGLLILRPNQAPVVRHLDLGDVRALYELRELLEVRALDLAWASLKGQHARAVRSMARQAAPGTRDWQRRCLAFDLALHRWWADACGNAWLRDDLDRHFMFLRLFQRWVGRDPAALAQSYDEHVAIVDAIANDDQPLARRLLSRHIRRSARLVEAGLARCPLSISSIRRRDRR